MLKPVAALLEKATIAKKIPGAVVRIEQGGRLLHESAHGVTRFDRPCPVTPETWFDLASLTKILATTPAVMLLAQRQKIDLQQPLGRYLPDLNETTAGQPLERFLNHTSGLLAWRPFFRSIPTELRQTASAREIMTRLLLAEKPVTEPGSRQVYSDINFALLGLAVEHLTAQPFHRFVQDEIYRPLGVDSLAFPETDPRPMPAVAATEDCPWRGRVLEGETHDENAWVVGGCAGHAGLFGAVAGISVLMEEFRSALSGRGRLFESRLVKRFMQRPVAIPEANHRLGFDSVSTKGSSMGRYFGPTAFGHHGFTGVSAWCDPDRGLTVVLLTNRVHPRRDNEFIKELRPLIHDLAAEGACHVAD